MGCCVWNSFICRLYFVKKVGCCMMKFNFKKRERNQRFFQSNFFPKNRKGELTTQQIILLIILIASFAIILFFLFRLNLGSETDAELCHNSVITRGSSVIPSDSVPLKCSREYVCITEDGSCEGMTNPQVEKVKTSNEVYSVLAGKMAECWWIYGAGSVDYVGKDFFKKDNYCSICSQILFDDSLNGIKDSEGNPAFESGEISKDDLYDFLAVAQYSDQQTYAEYLFGTNDLGLLKQTVSEDQNAEATFGKITIGKDQYWIVMGITSEVSGRAWKVAVGAVVGAVVGFISAPVAGIIAGAVIIGAGELGSRINPEILAIPVEGNGVDNTFMAPTIVEVNSEKFDALNCYSIESLY